MSLYDQILESFAAHGMQQALHTMPLSSFMPEYEVEDWVVLTDMQVDPEVGVQVLLTLALASSNNLVVVNLLPSTSKESALHCHVRSTPLHSVLEVRTSFTSSSDQDLSQIMVHVVTAESGPLALDAMVCGMPSLDGQHVDPDALSPLDQERVEPCLDPQGFIGEAHNNIIELVEDASLGSSEGTRSLMDFAASLSRKVAFSRSVKS